MTSRPLGVQRQAPRSLGSGLSQRPPQQRPQQPLPPSPIRKESSFPDLPDDAPSRYSTPRRGGSRLKLELSHDPGELDFLAATTESPKPVTPAADTPDSASPHPKRQNSDDPLPMPPRRRFALSRRAPPAPSAAPAKKDARPKPYAIETPADAPRYGKTFGHADFYPWTGDHAEDKFSETVIRQGYFDKASASQTETSSAKAALFASIKHKSGLHALSTVFTGVLGQRRHGGRITTPSTFKPPPRVTLTDTKRELWLKDLANPGISLRRLSRTIPHGIRGKVLLEHCLHKKVPVDRAVWLAKCVGANEIRAFKRKGVNGTFAMGGEVKWIRDWTVFVEQFVETVTGEGGEWKAGDEWKARVNYALRLATHLYAEHLLDRDHYMEWLLSGLENSPQARLPMWILITQIYWDDLLRLRRSGRRLVTALLSHLHLLQTHPDRDVLASLSARLTSLLSTLMALSPENFVSPSAWFKYRETLLASLPPDEPARRAFRAIAQRNEQLAPSGNRTRPAARHILVKMLDTTLWSLLSPDLPAQCWNVARDKPALARTLLEWCVSTYRPGLAKIYVAHRVLGVWSASGLDVTAAVLDFLDSPANQPGRSRAALYHLACELVRSGLLSVPAYIQWLMARGGVVRPRDVSPGAPWATRLLVELPTHALSPSQRSLRAGMLRRAAFDVDDEARDAEMALKCLQHTLGMPLDPHDPILQRDPLPVAKLCRRIALSGRSLKAEVGAWVRAHLDPASHASCTFDALRRVLEAAGDFSMLADVLKSIASVSAVDVLASCADTLNLHLPVFSAIGVARDLFDLLYARLRAAEEQATAAARPLLAALAALAPRIPKLELLAAQLRRELAQTDRTHPVDACSPVSDNMGARRHGSDGDVLDEVEKHLAGGTSLDRSTMDRFFQLLVGRLRTSESENLRAYALLLARLRVFDASHFDDLAAAWLRHLRTVSGPPVSRVLSVLVAVGCFGLPLVLASANDPSIPRYAQQVLELAVMPAPDDLLLAPDERYRLAILQDQAQRESPQELLAALRCAVECQQKETPLDKPATRDKLVTVLRSLTLRDLSGVCRALAGRPNAWIDHLTTRLLLPTDADADADAAAISFDQVLELTNEFTLPFCQLKLSLSLVPGESNSHLDLFAKAMDSAIDANNLSWTGMLPSLSPDITHHLKNRAQTRFLELLPSASSKAPLDQLQQAENLLAVVDAIIRGPAPAGRSASQLLAPAVVDKLSDLWDMLASPAADADAKSAVLRHWLPSLLTLITLHAAALDGIGRAGTETHARALVVLCGILQEVDSPSLALRIFDLALVLVDSLADDGRAQCVRCLRDATADPRPRYIFSFARPPAEHLMLSQRDKGAAGGTGRASNLPSVGLLGTPAALWGQTVQGPERLSAFHVRRWEMLNEPTPNVGENDTALNLGLFEARRVQ